MDEFIKCSLQNVKPEIATQFPESVEYHRKHQPGNMTGCDAFICICGNTADDTGFESTSDDRYRCAACGRIIDGSTGQVVGIGPDAHQLGEALKAAQEAFWGVVAARFPEVKTGDFPPDATFRFEDASRAAIDTWLAFNHPAYQSTND